MAQSPKIPEVYLCPITQDIMRDPVVDNEGISYERSAITQWLKKSNTSPISRKNLKNSDLSANLALKSLIEEWISNNNFDEAGKSEYEINSVVDKMITASLASNSKSNSQSAAVTASTAAKKFNNDISMNFNYDSTTKLTNFKLEGSSQPGRKPLNLVICLDNSGSMSAIANLKKEDGTQEFTGMSVLDIVRACACAIIESLSPKDKVSIVKFHDNAHKMLSLTSMDQQGKKLANQVLLNLEPENCTNLWDGIKVSFDSLLTAKYNPNIQEAVFILTDGQPNTHPNRAYLDELARYKKKNFETTGRPQPSVTTFGFGYSLATKLLCALADETGGRFVYIPDQGFVGTGMIHALSNTLATMTSNLSVKIHTFDGAKAVEDSGIHGRHGTFENGKIEINDVRLKLTDHINLLAKIDYKNAIPGQPCVKVTCIEKETGVCKDFIFNCPSGDETCATTKVQACRIAIIDALNVAKIKLEADLGISDYQGHGYRVGGRLNIGVLSKRFMEFHLARNTSNNVTSVADVINNLQTFITNIRDSLSASNNLEEKSLCEKYLQDLEGQIKEALNILPKAKKDNFYNKWGQHFIPSILRAHINQECNNFADPGIQGYGGITFEELRDYINDIYDDLPPPKQSLKNQARYYGGNNLVGTRTNAPIRMNMYNTRGGCFHGSSKVLTKNGLKDIKNLVKTDLIFDPKTMKFEKLVCLLKIVDGENKPMPMVAISKLDSNTNKAQDKTELKVTEYHPININNTWMFPREAVKNGLLKGRFYTTNSPVYNLITTGSSFIVNNFMACTLGHNLKEPIVQHEYLGNFQKIVRDLEKIDFDGLHERAFLILNSGNFSRNGNNFMIDGIVEGGRSICL